MIWFLTPLPTGRTHARCRLCGDEGTHMNDRAAELWARYHDPVQCGRRARVQRAEQANPTHDSAPLSTPEANPYPDTFPTPHSASLETQ